MFLTSADLPQAPGHAFYDRLNGLLAEAEFDRFVEDLCRPHYADEVGRPSLPPGTYFRMLFVGYFEGNRRRVTGARSKRLQKKRSEVVERSFAHVCETGGARRTWVRGRTNVSKRYLMQVAAHNLGAVMRSLFGVGKPRVLQGGGGAAFAAWVLLVGALIVWVSRWYGRPAR